MRGEGRVHQGNSEGWDGARLCSKNQEGPHCRVRSGTGPKQRPEGRQGDLSGQEDGDFGWGGWWGQGPGAAIASSSASWRPAQLGMAPIHQFVLPGCSRAPNVASAMQGRPTGGPLWQATNIPGLLPSQAFWKLPPLPSLRGPQARSFAITGGGTRWRRARAMPGWFTDSTSVVSTHPQNDPESLHFSLFKDSTFTPSPCVLVCVPPCFG